MWFRKDDKAKRNQWAQEIQDHRFMIQEEVQAALQEHRTDSNVRFGKTYFLRIPLTIGKLGRLEKILFFILKI